MVTQIKDKSGIKPKSVNILWVDDDFSIRILGKTLLERRGYKVETASNGKEAIEMLLQKKFDVMITDIGMPIMNGWQLVENINGKYEHMKILIISGYIDNISIEQKTKFGIESILEKPFQIDELERIIVE